MPGLVPGIHVFLSPKGVDGRDEPGHVDTPCHRLTLASFRGELR
jgi:hypothetical protein